MLGDASTTSGTTSVPIQMISYTQDGIESGSFVGLEITTNGVIYGRYDSGATQPLYRIPIATFSNPNALRALAGNVYQETGATDESLIASGEPEFSLFGTDESVATLVLGSVETSNVDLADAFSQMMVTQRAYSSAAQVVQTPDEMTTVVRDLMR